MTLVSLALATMALSAPSFAFLAPVDDVWQVWIAAEGRKPRAITSGPQDKVSLSAASGTAVLLAVTRNGEGLVLGPGGDVLETIELGAGAGDAALAPDGSRLVFAREEIVDGARTRRLWMIDRGSKTRRPLPAGPGLQHSPAWTRDGASLAFTATGEGGGEDLWLVRLDGSEESQLTTGADRYLEPSIAPDGSVYVSSDRGADYDIWRVDPADQSVRAVISRKGFDGHPSVSPDGRRILFVSSAGGGRAVWSADPDGSGARPLTDDSLGARDPVWLAASASPGPGAASRASAAPSEGFIAFLRQTDGSWQPWAARPDGGDLRRIASLPADVSRITLSSDGATLLADTTDGNLYVVTTADGKARRISVDPGGPTDAALSADGRRIVYSVNTLGGIDSNDLWVVGVEGGRAKKLTDEPYLQHFPVWGPGGAILYLSGNGGQNHDIRRFDPKKRASSLLLGGRLYNFEPAISSAGDVAFSSNREGDYEIWLLRSGSEEPRRLTRDPAYDGQPTFSPDGSKIAFLSRRGGSGRIWILDLASGEASRLPVDGELRLPVWTAGGPAGPVKTSMSEGG